MLSRVLSRVPPLAWLLAIVTPVWMSLGCVLAGWSGAALVASLMAVVIAGVIALAPAAAAPQRDTRHLEEPVGELWVRGVRTGVSSRRCGEKDVA